MLARPTLPVLAMLALTLWAPEAPAHTRSASYSSWQLDEDGARVRLRVTLLELTRLPPQALPAAADPIGAYLVARLRLLRAGEPCAPTAAPRTLRAPQGWAHYEWRVHCPRPGPAAIESHVLIDVAPSHLHFARLRERDGAALERVLTSAEPRWTLEAPHEEAPRAQGTSLGDYVLLGIEHILTGWDHLAFVLALLLLASRLGEVAGLVTSFTLAHSVTLGLAVLGVVRPHAGAVEALIGYSIALVALENAWLLSGRGRALPWLTSSALLGCTALAWLGAGHVPAPVLLGVTIFTACHFALLQRAERPARLRAAVAFGFGLVHGFGFAGVLAELELPTDRVVPALFGFNAGVELGQLAVVVIAWPLLRALAGLGEGRAYRVAIDAASAAICGLGLFWFTSRSFG